MIAAVDNTNLYNGSRPWPLSVPRARQIDDDEVLALSLQALQEYEENPVDETEFIADKTKQFLDSVWNQWLRFAERVNISPDETWVQFCEGLESAKARFRAFLETYVKTSKVRRPCLGPEEWHWVPTIKHAVTVEDVWAALVRKANMTVLKRKREEAPKSANIYFLIFSSRDNSSRIGPAYEIAQWIPKLANKLGLSLKQSFTKREATTEDIILLLAVLWERADAIRCDPKTRVAFHSAVLLAGIGGWRPSSVVEVKYKDVEMSWVRDPKDSSLCWLTAGITIHHVKTRKDRIERSQRSEIKFTITTIPCRQLCLLSFLTAVAIADNAFQANYRRAREVLHGNLSEYTVDNVPIRWKPEMLEKCIIPINYRTYLRLWNETLMVSGVRGDELMRPYSLRVGAGSRLDGSLTPSLRNYILHHSTDVFEKSYHPKHTRKYLPGIAWKDRAGGTERDAIVSQAATVLGRRDPDAPIYITQNDLDSFERRQDSTNLRKQYNDIKVADSKQAIMIKGRIKYILDVLCTQQIKQRREAYFAEVDRLRAQGLSTEHLSHRNASNARRQKKRKGIDGATRLDLYLDDEVEVLVDKLVAHLLLQDDDETQSQETTNKSKCLLCFRVFKNTFSLKRHVERHHVFDQEFQCPECRRQDAVNIVPAGGPSWSNHVQAFHGKEHTPNLLPQTVRPAYCPLCQNCFTLHGFRLHFNMTHAGQLKFPFNCPECLKNGLKTDDTVIKSHRNWSLHVEYIHEGGANIRGAIVKEGTKRKRSIHDDRSAYELEMEKSPDPHQNEEFWNSGRE